MNVISKEMYATLFTNRQKNLLVPLGDGQFDCPICMATHAAYTAEGGVQIAITEPGVQIRMAKLYCHVCHQESVYKVVAKMNVQHEPYDFKESLIYPKIDTTVAPHPNPDMPEDVKSLYNEAVSVLGASPRSANALARLAMQVLVQNITSDADAKTSLDKGIGQLVSEGLPKRFERMLDSVRIIGDKSVHPSNLDFSSLKNSKDLSLNLLCMVNLLAQYEYSDKKAFDNIYDTLDDGQKEHIDYRDNKATKKSE